MGPKKVRKNEEKTSPGSADPPKTPNPFTDVLRSLAMDGLTVAPGRGAKRGWGALEGQGASGSEQPLKAAKGSTANDVTPAHHEGSPTDIILHQETPSDHDPTPTSGSQLETDPPYEGSKEHHGHKETEQTNQPRSPIKEVAMETIIKGTPRQPATISPDLDASQYTINPKLVAYIRGKEKAPPLSYLADLENWYKDNWGGLVNPPPDLEGWMFSSALPDCLSNPEWRARMEEAQNNLGISRYRASRMANPDSPPLESLSRLIPYPTNYGRSTGQSQGTGEVSEYEAIHILGEKVSEGISLFINTINKFTMVNSAITKDYSNTAQAVLGSLEQRMKDLSTQARIGSAPILPLQQTSSTPTRRSSGVVSVGGVSTQGQKFKALKTPIMKNIK